MTSDDRLGNLMFLLSIAPLAAGCPGGDDTTGDTTGPTPTTSPTTTPTTDQTTGPEPMTTTMGMESTDGTTASTVDPDTTAGEETTAGDMLFCEYTEPPMVGEINPVCLEYANQYNECYYYGKLPQVCVDFYAAYCQYGIDYAIMEYGEACGTAVVDLYACLTALSCEELNEMKDPCPAEFMAVEMACMPK